MSARPVVTLMNYTIKTQCNTTYFQFQLYKIIRLKGSLTISYYLLIFILFYNNFIDVWELNFTYKQLAALRFFLRKVDRGNLHFIIFDFWDITCWVMELNAVLCPTCEEMESWLLHRIFYQQDLDTPKDDVCQLYILDCYTNEYEKRQYTKYTLRLKLQV